MLKEILKAREKTVAQIIQVKENAMINVPEGTLRFSTHGKGFQYYHYTSAEKPGGAYIKQSEQNLAKALKKKNIPYKYECPLELDSYGTIYPDFTVLNVKNRKEMYWEHFGLIDDRDYRDKNFNKLTYYEANDYFPGDKLIMTFEATRQPLSSKLIEKIINRYLL